VMMGIVVAHAEGRDEDAMRRQGSDDDSAHGGKAKYQHARGLLCCISGL